MAKSDEREKARRGRKGENKERMEEGNGGCEINKRSVKLRKKLEKEESLVDRELDRLIDKRRKGEMSGG